MMSNKNSLTRKTIAIALAAGVGFGGLTFNPVWPTTQVEAAASRYSTDQLKALATLNEYRKQAGMKPVTLDPLLTKAATNHYNYLDTNGLAYGHDEVKGHKGFTGVKVKDRVKAVGGSVGVSLSENIVFVAKNSPNSIFDLVHNAPLHRESLLDPDATSVGIESQKGTQSGIQVIVVRVDDYVQRETDHVYPTPNATEVVPLFDGNEIPDPLKDYGIEQSGHILTYWMPSEIYIYDDNDFSFILRDSKGNVVPSFVDFMYGGAARLIPKKILNYNERYTATVKWKADAFNKTGGRTWSFTTQAISTEPVKPGTPVDVVKESKDYTLIKGQPLYASNSTSSKQLVQIPTNGKVRSIEKRSSWMKVTYNGKTGFVAAKNLKPYVAPKTVGMYATKDMKAYATRSAKGKVSFTVPRGKKVERLTVDGSWAQVKYGSKTGWVASRELSSSRPASNAKVTKTWFGAHKYGVDTQAEYDAVYKRVKAEFDAKYNSPEFGFDEYMYRVLDGERGTRDTNHPEYRKANNAGLLRAEMALEPYFDGRLSMKTYEKMYRTHNFLHYISDKYKSTAVEGDRNLKSAYDVLFRGENDCDSKEQVKSLVYDLAGIDNVIIGDGATHALLLFKVDEGWMGVDYKTFTKKDIDSTNALNIYISYTQKGKKIAY